MRINSLRTLLVSLLVLGLGTSTAWAHHGGGTFDANKCFVFKGTVRQVAWVNPHAWIYVEVPKGEGAPELWGFEFSAFGSLMRAGFKSSDFAIGSKITVTAYANRAVEKHTGSANTVVLADGRQAGGAVIAGTAPAGAPAGADSANCPNYN